MRYPSLTLLLAGLWFLGLGSPGDLLARTPLPDPVPEAVSGSHGFSALVFSRTAGFRHDSIETGIAAIQALAAEHDFEVTATEDPAVFTDEGLAGFDLVIFLNTTGDVLDPAQQAAMERFIKAGHGYVGVHAAADTEYGWDWYGGLVGARFSSHPNIQDATVRVLDRDHPSTSALPIVWERNDEWYDYQTNPREEVHVLATLDPDSYSGSTMGHDHPIAWCRNYDGGRAWYTGMGHTQSSYGETGFRNHLLGGIEWAAGAVQGDCSATIGASFDFETLENNVDSPMDLAVLPDGSVLFVELGGAVKKWDVDSGVTSVVNRIQIAQNHEDGLLGIVLDPSFETTGWIYLFYSPAGSEAKQHVSRFTWTGSALDPASEIVLLEIPTQRDECCHSSGSMAFDANGNLYISTGDNTNPFASNGHAPIDERAGRSAWDAQKSSANTADLRGKILRITPAPDGSYTTPSDNLFPDGSGGRAEIYTMGLRNPFRISIDPTRGWLYWGDVGPDARNDHSSLGPKGYDEWNQARTAGNYGWPYCIGPNLPYGNRDFATETVSGTFDCSAPVNDSPNNTGATNLPPARPAWIWYPYDHSNEFPGVLDGNGRTAMAGPVYQFEQVRPGDGGLPAYFNDRLLIYEWSRNYILVVTLDEEGAPLSIDPLPGSRSLAQPISMKQGPDGSLYLLEWGTGFGTGNPDARLSRITFGAGGRRPVALLDADVNSGPVPLTVNFSAARSFDPDGDPLQFSWDLDGDGAEDATGIAASYTYTENGDYLVQLTVRDPGGNESQDSFRITAGNTRPQMVVESPVPRGVVEWGDHVAYRLSVTDAEDGSTADGSIDCADVEVQVFIGHDSHTHPLTTTNGCEGEVALAGGHGDEGDRLFHVIEFRYTDSGAGNAAAITAIEQRVLWPNRIEAEHYDEMNGIQTEATSDPQGGAINVGWIENGDWLRFDDIDLSGIDFVTFRVASAGIGGTIELRRTGIDGPRIAQAVVVNSGGWQNWRDVTVPVVDPVNEGPLYLVFTEGPGTSSMFNVNYLVFHGPGASTRTQGATGFDATHVVPQGQRLLNRVEPQLSFDWAQKAPLVAASVFQSTWEGVFWPPTSGTYSLTLRLQGSGSVRVDNQEVASVSSQDAIREARSRALVWTQSEPVPLSISYSSGSGGSRIWLEMTGPGFLGRTVGGDLVTPGLSVSAMESAVPPTRFALSRPYPNPASGEISLDLDLPRSGEVRVELFDLLGRRTVARSPENLQAGSHQLRLPMEGLVPGVYFVVVSSPHGTSSHPIVKVH